MIFVDIKKTHPKAEIPRKMSELAAGYDIYACLEEEILIKSGRLALIPSGFALSLPPGYEAQIRPRSGLAAKYQIGVLNSPGTVDADYRGEVKIILFNFGEEDFIVRHGDRIAQIVIAKHENAEFNLRDELDETVRNTGGFGSTEI
ncbi:MAG: dUTP diphosphatase [Candidatus Cloacimonadota bacterium]|nr:MAG: dUTP diphosphatase [Candidatus Cloacimonadota bacterium]